MSDLSPSVTWHGTRRDVRILLDALQRWHERNPGSRAASFVANVINRLHGALLCDGDQVGFEAKEVGVRKLVDLCADNGIGEALFLHRALLASRTAKGL